MQVDGSDVGSSPARPLLLPFQDFFCEWPTHPSFGSVINATILVPSDPSLSLVGTARWTHSERGGGWFCATSGARMRLSRIDPAGRSRSHAPGCEAAHSGTLPSYAPPSRFYAPPHSGSAGAGRQTALRLPFASGCAHRRRGICGHPALWQQAYIDILPDVASGSCVQLRLSLRAFPVGIARQRDRMRTLRATCIATGPVIWHHIKIRHKHAAISVSYTHLTLPTIYSV